MDTSGSISQFLSSQANQDMKSVLLALVSVVGLFGLVEGAVSAPPAASAPGKGSGEGGLIVMAAPLAEGGQQLTVIDPAQRVMCIYHIGAKNGEISLKSVRNISWDMRMTQFNGVNPQPEEIRSLVEQR